MELNAKCPFVWDWDSLVMFPSRVVEVPKKFQVLDSVFDAIDGFELGSLHSSGGRSDGVVSGGSASDLAYGSSSKSSKSASVDSSLNREMRESKFTLETNDCFSQDPGSVKELASAWPTARRTSPTADISIGSSDLLIGLKLGKRTYFEDVSASSNTKTSVSVSGLSDATAKRSKLSCIAIPRCQVEGCNLDLSSAKSYHRKHRVCESHSKSPEVVICGLERRFCQQCSRFHSLSEFDQKKRSCRRRLSDHNARRRKPKPEVIQFNSMSLSPSLQGRANQVSLALDRAPMVHSRPNASSTWDFTANSKYTRQEKFSLFSPVKRDFSELQVSCSKPEDTGFKLSYNFSQFLPSSRVPPTQVFHRGLQVPTTSNTNMEATQDDLRALSLLSTNSWGVSSCDQVQHHQDQPPASLHHHFDNNGTTTNIVPSQSPSSHPPLTAPPVQAAPVSLPSAQPVETHCWQGNQQLQVQPASVSLQKNGGNNHFHEYQLFKAPNEPSFYLY